jgi:hypothetical protein
MLNWNSRSKSAGGPLLRHLVLSAIRNVNHDERRSMTYWALGNGVKEGLSWRERADKGGRKWEGRKASREPHLSCSCIESLILTSLFGFLWREGFLKKKDTRQKNDGKEQGRLPNSSERKRVSSCWRYCYGQRGESDRVMSGWKTLEVNWAEVPDSRSTEQECPIRGQIEKSLR